MDLAEPIDIFVVVTARDIKLLRHFFLSYQVFFRQPGNIHLLIWYREKHLLDQIECPRNLVVHYKDSVDELCEDDFRNQMYLKLIADRFVETKWFWVVDCDFLICAPLTWGEFCRDGKPIWCVRPWTKLAEKTWRDGTEAFVGANIPVLFMDEPVYVFNRLVLQDMRNRINVKQVLSQPTAPSEFAAYGFFAHSEYHHLYSWQDTSKIQHECVAYRVNQKPPSYLVLDRDSNLSDAANAKYVVFWSHWELAESKMRDYLLEAQRRYFGQVRLLPEDNIIFLPVTLDMFAKDGAVAWDGIYPDGWVKSHSAFTSYFERPGIIELQLEVPEAGGVSDTAVVISIDGSEHSFPLNVGVNAVDIPIKCQAEKVKLIFSYNNNGQESHCRTLIARVNSFCFLDR